MEFFKDRKFDNNIIFLISRNSKDAIDILRASVLFLFNLATGYYFV